jgi:hypothetical protein
MASLPDHATSMNMMAAYVSSPRRRYNHGMYCSKDGKVQHEYISISPFAPSSLTLVEINETTNTVATVTVYRSSSPPTSLSHHIDKW